MARLKQKDWDWRFAVLALDIDGEVHQIAIPCKEPWRVRRIVVSWQGSHKKWPERRLYYSALYGPKKRAPRRRG